MSSETAAAASPSAAAVAPAHAESAATAAASDVTPATPVYATRGALLTAGSHAHSTTGRSGPPASGFDGVAENNLYNFQVLEVPGAGYSVERVVAGPTASHFFALVRPDGSASSRVYAWGRNERGQLGLGHTRNVYVPEPVPGLDNIVAAAVGRTHSLWVTAAGDVFAAGENKSCQCGLGKTSSEPVAKPSRVPGITGIVAVAAGIDFSIALDKSGRVFTCGSQQYGQCGTGTTGEYIISAGKSAFAEVPAFKQVPALARIEAIAAGANHGVAMDTDGIVYTWGAGTRGRCGHGDVADVLIPRAVKQLELPRMRCKYIAAGDSITYVVTRQGDMLYHFGLAKKSGEAALYPKPISDLAGWKVRSIASGNTSTVCAADLSVVAWGPSPTCGELGFGEATKSSTKCKLVDDLEGCYAIQTGMGYATSYVVLDVSSDTAAGRKGKALLEEGKIAKFVAPAAAKAGPAGTDATSASAGTKRPAGATVAAAVATQKKKK